MAQRRMFAKTIIDSDAFLDMPATAQLLYFHLSMRADDDGFINQPKSIMRMTGCKDDDMKLLIIKKFIIPFETGIVVIKHWKIHNYIAKDRYTETKYKEEKSQLILDDNNAYTTCIQNRIQPVDETETQVRLGKGSLSQDNINSASNAQINAFFDSIWDLYPVKKGKGQVSESKRKALYNIGFDKIKTAIERYQQELAKDAEWRKPQNGSTFFNSGYVDYLDENYSPTPTTTTASTNRAIVNGREYEVRNGKYYIPNGNGIEVNPFAEDDLPF